jgi:DNA-binding PadR family transcriptional regulator
MTRLEEKCGGAYRASAGAIYPTLQQLEDEDLVRVKSENGKKTYEITAAGKKELDAHKDDVDGIWSRAETRSEWGVFREPEAAEIIGPALRLAKTALRTIARSHGDPDVVERVREIFDDARAEIARIERRRRR